MAPFFVACKEEPVLAGNRNQFLQNLASTC